MVVVAVGNEWRFIKCNCMRKKQNTATRNVAKAGVNPISKKPVGQTTLFWTPCDESPSFWATDCRDQFGVSWYQYMIAWDVQAKKYFNITQKQKQTQSMHFQPGGAALCSEYIELSTLHPGTWYKDFLQHQECESLNILPIVQVKSQAGSMWQGVIQ